METTQSRLSGSQPTERAILDRICLHIAMLAAHFSSITSPRLYCSIRAKEVRMEEGSELEELLDDDPPFDVKELAGIKNSTRLLGSSRFQ